MIASPIGEIAQSCWNEIPQHFKYIELGSFVVMPNHVHGIIIIDKPDGMVVENEMTINAHEGNSTNAHVETRLTRM